jgi:AmpE protein
MMFLTILISLLVERFYDLSRFRQWGWFDPSLNVFTPKLPESIGPGLSLVIAIAPPLVAVIISEFFLKKIMFGYPLAIVELLLMLYLYGPQNFWTDAKALNIAIVKEHGNVVADQLLKTFNVNSSNNSNKPETIQHQMINEFFVAGNQRVFAIIFWFMVAGLPGALLYRLIKLSTDYSTSPSVTDLSRKLLMLLDWPSFRLQALFFTFGLNSSLVMSCWRKSVFGGVRENYRLLTDCGVAAITDNADRFSADGKLGRSAISLVTRSLVMLTILELIIKIFVV